MLKAHDSLKRCLFDTKALKNVEGNGLKKDTCRIKGESAANFDRKRYIDASRR